MAPSPTSSQYQTSPLLPHKPKAVDDQQSQSLSPVTSNAIKALSILRMGIGAACLVAPRWSCALFQFPVPAAYSVMARLFGVRDLALGGLLLTAEEKSSPSGGRREIRRALWAGIVCDFADAASIAFGLATGNTGRAPAAIFAGGAVAFIGLGAVGLCGL